ncbi:MAG TPA: pilus assembly protein CpaA [Brevundimonas sp.]|nr:pilus assembly protein CpaA [Brevundimonas sp.]
MDMLILLSLAALPALMVVAGLQDLATMRISNWVSLALLAAFVLAALLAGLSWAALAQHFAAGAVVLFVAAAMFGLRWIGGGDAKLMAAGALWLGPSALLPFVLFVALAGGAFCILLMSARTWCQPYAASAPEWAARLIQPKGDIPYGVAIAIGALLAYPSSPLMTAFIAG